VHTRPSHSQAKQSSKDNMYSLCSKDRVNSRSLSLYKIVF